MAFYACSEVWWHGPAVVAVSGHPVFMAESSGLYERLASLIAVYPRVSAFRALLVRGLLSLEALGLYIYLKIFAKGASMPWMKNEGRKVRFSFRERTDGGELTLPGRLNVGRKPPPARVPSAPAGERRLLPG